MAWQVHKFISGQDYGFLVDESGTEVYFHLEAFVPGTHEGPSPIPPLRGEIVEVELAPVVKTEERKAPKATRVTRTQPPQLLTGTVEDFNPKKGFGFIRGADGKSYYLHRSEVQDGRLPLPGKQADFYVGAGQTDRPRACYVTIS